ncbi:MAG TPA: hypothetical protein VIJ68_00615 [Candidatus Saccharimonadales bacterium]
MNKSQLLNKLRNEEYILPKDIVSDDQLDELAQALIEIFKEQKSQLESEKRLQQNYLEVVNYLLVTDLNSPKSRRHDFFDTSFLNALISLPATP